MKPTAIRRVFAELVCFEVRSVEVLYTDVHLTIFSLFQGIPHDRGLHTQDRVGGPASIP